MNRVVIVVNAAARGQALEIAEGASRALDAAGIEAHSFYPPAPGGVTELVAEAATDPKTFAVAVVGGDGTVREAAEGMARGLGTWPDGGPARSDAPTLFVLGGGTGNSVRHALWGGATWEDVVAALAAGTHRRVDLDLAAIEGRDRGVLLGASTGFFRWAVEAVDRVVDHTGRDRYFAAGLLAAEEIAPYRGAVEVDGNVVAAGRLALVAVGGAAQRGGRVAVLPGSRLDDGLLDVCAIAVSGADEFVPIMAKALSGDHLGEPGVTWARGRRVVLRSDDGPLPFEHDGELWEGNERRLELGVVPAAVPAAVPATGAVARN